MKTTALSILFLVGLLSVALTFADKQAEPWTPFQLMEPAILAETINSPGSNKPLIISIGPAATIKTSVAIGPGSEAPNLAKLEALLQPVDRNREVVIYCGCCPFTRCPNVRPAFTLLNKLKFTNAKLLNLSTNLKTDWIDKGYPVIE